MSRQLLNITQRRHRLVQIIRKEKTEECLNSQNNYFNMSFCVELVLEESIKRKEMHSFGQPKS